MEREIKAQHVKKSEKYIVYHNKLEHQDRY